MIIAACRLALDVVRGDAVRRVVLRGASGASERPRVGPRDASGDARRAASAIDMTPRVSRGARGS
jgi:hypothetical protein